MKATHRNLCITFLMILPLLNTAQKCRIPYENGNSEQIKKNRIKEIKIYSETNAGAQADMHYYFDQKGCCEKLINYDQYSNKKEPLISEYKCSKNNTERVYTNGRSKLNGFILSERESETYSPSGKLLKLVREENIDLKKITTQIFDTAYNEKIDYRSLVLYPNGSDTINYITNFFDLHTKTFILRTKTNSVWEETEKIITTYKNGDYDEVFVYKKGSLFNHYTKKMMEEKGKNGLNENVQAFNNPLPTNEALASDTIFTDDENFSFNKQTKGNKNSKYFAVRYHQRELPENIERIELYNRKQQLLLRKLTKRTQGYTRYEYVFY